MSKQSRRARREVIECPVYNVDDGAIDPAAVLREFRPELTGTLLMLQNIPQYFSPTPINQPFLRDLAVTERTIRHLMTLSNDGSEGEPAEYQRIADAGMARVIALAGAATVMEGEESESVVSERLGRLATNALEHDVLDAFLQQAPDKPNA